MNRSIIGLRADQLTDQEKLDLLLSCGEFGTPDRQQRARDRLAAGKVSARVGDVIAEQIYLLREKLGHPATTSHHPLTH